MTALDMQGFYNCTPFSEELSEALAAPTASKYF